MEANAKPECLVCCFFVKGFVWLGFVLVFFLKGDGNYQ